MFRLDITEGTLQGFSGNTSAISRSRAENDELSLGDSVPVLVLTHTASEAAVRSAIEIIDELDDVTAPTRLVRIEDEL